MAFDPLIRPVDGRVIEDRSPHDFSTDPQSDRAKAFLSEILKH
ncbi:hypothetical protein [Streptomyces sp. NPDC003023]